MTRAVALSARDVRRVGLTAHASRSVAVERRVLPTAAVATLDNGVLRRVSRSPGKSLPHGGDSSPAAPDQGACEAGPSLGQPAPAPAAPELPPEADRLAVPEAALEGDAADVWRDVIVSITEPVRQVARRQDLVALHVVVVGGHQREGPPLVSPIMMVITGGASL